VGSCKSLWRPDPDNPFALQPRYAGRHFLHQWPYHLYGSFIHKDDRSPPNQDADQAAVGVVYSLSKRTALHASFAHIRNRNGAPYTAGTATESGKGSRAITFGLRHAF